MLIPGGAGCTDGWRRGEAEELGFGFGIYRIDRSGRKWGFRSGNPIFLKFGSDVKLDN